MMRNLTADALETGVGRLGPGKQEEQLDDQTRRFREQVGGARQTTATLSGRQAACGAVHSWFSSASTSWTCWVHAECLSKALD